MQMMSRKSAECTPHLLIRYPQRIQIHIYDFLDRHHSCIDQKSPQRLAALIFIKRCLDLYERSYPSL